MRLEMMASEHDGRDADDKAGMNDGRLEGMLLGRCGILLKYFGLRGISAGIL
jgi:hypothetical protein